MHLMPKGMELPVIENVSKTSFQIGGMQIAVLQVFKQVVTHGCKGSAFRYERGQCLDRSA